MNEEKKESPSSAANQVEQSVKEFSKAVISDVDGTISDRRHRLHFLEGKKDWRSFFSLLSQDPPINSTIRLLEEFHHQGVKIIFFTGRPKDYERETIEWLDKNLSFDDYLLFMRPNKDFRKDIDIKKEMLREVQTEFRIIKAFDDQLELIDLWQKSGIDCINCSLD